MFFLVDLRDVQDELAVNGQCSKDHDAYQVSLNRLLRDLTVGTGL
ncbi:MAG TPA: hypothetical protein VHT48_06160 [Methylocella sp.]|nr:hypothetical protein [Methylocella sp.]